MNQIDLVILGVKVSPNYKKIRFYSDEISFDLNYKSEPLSTFEPMVRRVLKKQWVTP
jgi:hypothetical protein